MNPIRLLWLIVAMLLMSYVSVGYLLGKRAEAATQEQVTALMTAFSTTKIRVLTTRRIAFWDARSNQTAHCWIFFVPNNIATPSKGQGFYAHQWVMSETSATVTEEQCYAQP